MAKRCTPFQTTQRNRPERPQVRVVERKCHVYPFSHSFDNLDGGDRRLVWRLESPVSGSILEPAISSGVCTGALSLEAVFNGVSAGTIELNGSMKRVGKTFPVKQGDVIELYVSGEGNAKDVAVSLVIREG